MTIDDVARRSSVAASLRGCGLLRVSGRDPKRKKIEVEEVYDIDSGVTTFSASAFTFTRARLNPAASHSGTSEGPNDKNVYVMCPGNVIAPFLKDATDTPSGSLIWRPQLLPDTLIEYVPEAEGRDVKDERETAISCTLLCIEELPAVDRALSRLSRNGGPWVNSWGVPTKRTQVAYQYSSGLTRTSALVALLRLEFPPTAQASRPAGYSLSTAHHLPWAPAPRAVSRGSRIQVVSSPFGLLHHHLFRNTVSEGIVSNVVLDSSQEPTDDGSLLLDVPSLLLLDARCLPGAEGAVVVNKFGQVVGMVTLPLKHADYSSSVDLNLAIPHHILRLWVLSCLDLDRQKTGGAAKPREGEKWDAMGALRRNSERIVSSSVGLPPVCAVPDAERSVVVVKIGGSWASGVVVSDDGIIFTNLHLVLPYMREEKRSCFAQPSMNVHVRIQNHNKKWAGDRESGLPATTTLPPPHAEWFSASTLYASTGPWDVCILKVDTPFKLFPARFPEPCASLESLLTVYESVQELPPAPSSLCETLYPRGTSVFVVGHALFGPPTGLQPSFTKGVISHSVCMNGYPVILQCTAAVHSGNSGGALLSSDGVFLGMVTSNLHHKNFKRDHLLFREDSEHCKPHASTITELNFSIPSSVLCMLLPFVRSIDRCRYVAERFNFSPQEIGKGIIQPMSV